MRSAVKMTLMRSKHLCSSSFIEEDDSASSRDESGNEALHHNDTNAFKWLKEITQDNFYDVLTTEGTA